MFRLFISSLHEGENLQVRINKPACAERELAHRLGRAHGRCALEPRSAFAKKRGHFHRTVTTGWAGRGCLPAHMPATTGHFLKKKRRRVKRRESSSVAWSRLRRAKPRQGLRGWRASVAGSPPRVLHASLGTLSYCKPNTQFNTLSHTANGAKPRVTTSSAAPCSPVAMRHTWQRCQSHMIRSRLLPSRPLLSA